MSEAGVVQLVTVDEDWDTVESNERMVGGGAGTLPVQVLAHGCVGMAGRDVV